jgi:hypothetical protein
LLLALIEEDEQKYTKTTVIAQITSILEIVVLSYSTHDTYLMPKVRLHAILQCRRSCRIDTATCWWDKDCPRCVKDVLFVSQKI